MYSPAGISPDWSVLFRHRSAEIPDYQRWRFNYHTAKLQHCYFGQRFWFSLMPREKMTIMWTFALPFFPYKLTKCLNVLSDSISVAMKVQVTSCLIQNSATHLYLMHTQPLSNVSDWAPKLMSDFWKNWAVWMPRASFRQSPSALLKSLPIFQARKMPGSSSKKQRSISHEKNTTSRSTQTDSPKNVAWNYLFFFQVYQTDHRFSGSQEI